MRRNNGYRYIPHLLARFGRRFIVNAGQSSWCSVLSGEGPTDAHLNVPVETKKLLCFDLRLRLMRCLAGRISSA